MLCPVTTLAVLGTACSQPLFSILMENKGDRAAVLENTQAGGLLTAGLPAGAAKALEAAVGRWRTPLQMLPPQQPALAARMDGLSPGDGEDRTS